MRAGTWRQLAQFFSAPGFTDGADAPVPRHRPAPADGERLGPDEDERLILEWMPWREAVAAAERGEIRDAKSILGLLWLARSADDRLRASPDRKSTPMSPASPVPRSSGHRWSGRPPSLADEPLVEAGSLRAVPILAGRPPIVHVEPSTVVRYSRSTPRESK